MDLKNQLTRTPYLVLFIILITVGVGTASALVTITLAGNVNITGDADIDGNLNVDGTITGFETLEGLNCVAGQDARFDGNNWVCGKFMARNNPITTVDSTDNVGFYSSIAIGTDGFPVISYWDFTNFAVKVVHCGNTSCSAGNTITTVDSTDCVGQYSSIAIGKNDNPVVSYTDCTNFDLKVVHCGNTSCSSGNTVITVDGTDNVGFYTSIAIGTDNNPVISYHDSTNLDLKVVHCGSPDSCASGNTITTVDGADDVGTFTSIAIGTDNNPVISYFDITNDDLKVVHCGDADCAESVNSNTITTVDSTDLVGQYSSIAIGTDGFPVISYYHITNDDLKVVHCGTVSCSAGNHITTVDSAGVVGLSSSLEIGTDGLPVISYYDDTNDDLKVVHCGNESCSAGNTITTVDSTITATLDTHIAISIGTNGSPVISYYDFGDKDLKVAVDGTVLIFE